MCCVVIQHLYIYFLSFCRSPGCSPLWHARIPSGEGPEICLCLTGKVSTFSSPLLFCVRVPWCVLRSKASHCLLNNFIFLLRTFLFVGRALFFQLENMSLFHTSPWWFLQCLGTADNWPWKSSCHSTHVLLFSLCKLNPWAGEEGSDGVTQTS